LLGFEEGALGGELRGKEMRVFERDRLKLLGSDANGRMLGMCRGIWSGGGGRGRFKLDELAAGCLVLDEAEERTGELVSLSRTE
jgi:hypothetical protein